MSISKHLNSAACPHHVGDMSTIQHLPTSAIWYLLVNGMAAGPVLRNLRLNETFDGAIALYSCSFGELVVMRPSTTLTCLQRAHQVYVMLSPLRPTGISSCRVSKVLPLLAAGFQCWYKRNNRCQASLTSQYDESASKVLFNTCSSCNFLPHEECSPAFSCTLMCCCRPSPIHS